MTDVFILRMPVKLSLELVPIVGADFLDQKRELLDDMINEVDRVSLRVFKGDSECPDPRCDRRSRYIRSFEFSHPTFQ